jgi:hypothetical protein
MRPCPNPRCKDGEVILPAPIITVDHRGRPVMTDRLPCTECIGGVASCCDGAGSAQPEPRRD